MTISVAYFNIVYILCFKAFCYNTSGDKTIYHSARFILPDIIEFSFYLDV